MAEAGFPNGFETSMYSDTTEISKSSTLAIQQDLAKIGITVKLVPQDFDVLLGTITVPHQAPLVFIGWFQDFPDPSDFFDPILSCATAVAGSFNTAGYCNKEVDALGVDRAGRAGRHRPAGDVSGDPEDDHGRRAVGSDPVQRIGHPDLRQGHRQSAPPDLSERPAHGST